MSIHDLSWDTILLLFKRVCGDAPSRLGLCRGEVDYRVTLPEVLGMSKKFAHPFGIKQRRTLHRDVLTVNWILLRARRYWIIFEKRLNSGCCEYPSVPNTSDSVFVITAPAARITSRPFCS